MDKFLEFNNILLSITGITLFGAILRFTSWLVKLVKAKIASNRLRKKEIEALRLNYDVQAKRIDELEKYRELDERRAKMVIDGQKASLHNQIWNKADLYISRGFITVGELNNFQYLVKAYKDLEGNGTGDILNSKVIALEVRDEGLITKEEM